MDVTRVLAAYRTLSGEERRGHGLAIAELLQALELHAARINAWFAQHALQLSPHPRAAILTLLLARVPSFARWVRAGVAVARSTSMDDFEAEWGAMLEAAFPTRDGELRSAAHNRLVFALLDNPALDDEVLLPHLASFGLPAQREACVAALGHRPFGSA